MVTVMKISTFDQIIQSKVQCSSTTAASLAYTFQACTYDKSSTEEFIFYQEYMTFYRLHNDYSANTNSGSTMHNPSPFNGQAKALTCLSEDLIYSLIHSGGEAPFVFIIAEVNFTNAKITYTRYSQQSSGTSLKGYILNKNEFFLAGLLNQGAKVYHTPSSSFSVGNTKIQGIIYSPLLSCQQVDGYQLYSSVQMTVNAYPFTSDTLAYTQTSIPLIDKTSAAVVFNVISSAFEGQYSSKCPYAFLVTPYYYQNLQSTQPTNTFIYIIEEQTRKFTISPFTADILEPSAPPPQFTYSVLSFDGPPQGVKVNPSTGEIEVSSIQLFEETKYQFVIQGKLQECSRIEETFDLVGEPNVPPIFDKIENQTLPSIFIAQGQTIDYPLPSVVDSNHGQTPYVIITDVAGTLYPDFVDFTNSSHTIIRVFATSALAPGVYNIQVKICDGIVCPAYDLQVIVLVPPPEFAIQNLGPPAFTEDLEPVQLQIGKSFSYTLPPISDPDEDKFYVTAQLKDSASFVVFNNASLKFTFNPTNMTAIKTNYEISVVLTDLNKEPQSAKYQISLIINGTAPKNIPKPPQEPSSIQNSSQNATTSNQNASSSNSTTNSSSSNTTSSSQNQTQEISESESQGQQSDEEYSYAQGSQRGKIKTYKCDVLITQVSRAEKLQLKVVSPNKEASENVARAITEADIDLRISSSSAERVQIKIEDILSSNTLVISMVLKNKDQISQGVELDYVTIKILKRIFIKKDQFEASLQKDATAKAKMPSQYSESQLKAVALVQSTEKPTMITVMSVNLVVQLFFGSMMCLIWSMMNDLSFLIQLSMVSIQIPGIASSIQSILLSVIYLDLLMTDQWLTPFLDMLLSSDESDDDQPVNTFLDDQGFKSKLLVLNLGSTLIFLVMQVLLLFFTGISSLLKRHSRIAKRVYDYLSVRLFWGGTIRFIIQQFQPLLMSSIININNFSVSELKEKPSGMIFSYSLSIAIIAILLLSIIVFAILVRIGKAKQKEYEPLIEGIDTNKSGLAPYWTVLTLLKWLVLCTILILLTDHPAQQLQILLILSIASTITQAVVGPQVSTLDRWISLFNEGMACVYIYAMCGLAIAGDVESRDTMGLALLSITLITILVNIIKVLAVSVVMCKHKFKGCDKNKVITLKQKIYAIKVSSFAHFQVPAKLKRPFEMRKDTQATSHSMTVVQDVSIQDFM
ncbi:hypothetical protein FGO68_gene5593 [Halteria grandinella]|uniref:Cadherin domain-containing protein n=1 Tax=Halteria grandinella TaxID=5974 RepID=A0A8J8P670_HALGN|nr:hypothetical protein FGO68_gene5593 [Halteria grandinella]